MANNNNKGDDFASLYLLSETAFFLSLMEMLAPRHPLVTSYRANNGPSDLKLLIKRKIRKGDVRPSYSRLSIPRKQVLSGGFLTEQEEEMVVPQENELGIGVSLFLPELGMTEDVRLRLWNGHTPGPFYAVCGGGWCNIISQNFIQEGDNIQLWSFRDGSKRLCLILVKDN